MIKFCGNCGTTITNKDVAENRAMRSGKFVYCNKCASKLGFSPGDQLNRLPGKEKEVSDKVKNGQKKWEWAGVLLLSRRIQAVPEVP